MAQQVNGTGPQGGSSVPQVSQGKITPPASSSSEEMLYAINALNLRLDRQDLQTQLTRRLAERKVLVQRLAKARGRQEACSDAALIENGFWDGVKVGKVVKKEAREFVGKKTSLFFGASALLATWAVSAAMQIDDHQEQGTRLKADREIERLKGALTANNLSIKQLLKKIQALGLPAVKEVRPGSEAVEPSPTPTPQ